jgi:hypothetical protein
MVLYRRVTTLLDWKSTRFSQCLSLGTLWYTGLLILLNYTLSIFEAGEYLFEATPTIVVNMDKLYLIFNDIIGTLGFIVVFYTILYISNRRIDRFYKDFKELHPNLIETKTNYYLSIQLFKTFYNLHDFSTAILIFIATVQYNLLNKKINVANYIILNLYALVQSGYQWYKNYPIHKQNDKKYLVQPQQYIKNSKIQVNDILYLRRNNSLRVKEGLVLDQDVVAMNLGQTGERTIEEFKVGSTITDGLVIKNQELVRIKVTKTYNTSPNNEIVEDNINTVSSLNTKSTNIAFCTILVFTTYIIVAKTDNTLDIVEVLLDLIGCFIGLNYLIPSFKIQQSLNLWDSVYKHICENYYYFRVCNHGDIDKVLTPDTTVILSDKTGTLTNNILTIEKNYVDTENIDLILGHINSYLDDDAKHTSHSPETNVIADFLCHKYNIKQTNRHRWIDNTEIIDFTYTQDQQTVTRHKKLTYKDVNLGSHSLIRRGDNYYHVFMGSKALLENRLDYKPQVDSPKRGLLIGYIPLSVENLSGFLSSLEEFRNTSAPLEADKYKVIAEFHFNNFYRECEDQTTRRGVERLQDAGYSFYMITGDSLVTARDIGLELGIIGTEGMVIDGMEFMKLTSLEKDNVILELLDKGTGIFGNTRAIYKEKIVELFQKHRRVVFLGDQENDYLAIKKADLGIVQERGNKKCKNIGHVIGKIPTETAFYYLSKYRDIGIDGKWWFYKELVRFNYTTAGIWLMGIGPKLNLLFIDPWEPLHSLIMSISITMLLVYKSITFRNTKVNYDSITYYTPLYSLAKALFIGLLVSMVLTELYSKLSILIISTVMVFSI